MVTVAVLMVSPSGGPWAASLIGPSERAVRAGAWATRGPRLCARFGRGLVVFVRELELSVVEGK